MKKASDPRHIARIKIMQELFSHDFKPGRTSKGAREVIVALPQIDQVVAKSAPEWPVAKINKVDLAILRLAVFELIIEKEAPPKVIVDEATRWLNGIKEGPFFLNVWFGYLRRNKKKFSFLWFLYIHLSIPFIVPLRISWDIGLKFVPLIIFVAVLGQLVGARLLPRFLKRT